MKPRKEHNRIIGPSGCISKEGLSLYLRNELAEKEKNIFEQHVAGCLLCHEALEGYEKHQNSDSFLTGIGPIQNEFKSRFAGSSNKSLKKSGIKKTLIISVSIAASFILIITSYFLINIQIKETTKDLSFNAPQPTDNHIAEKQKTTTTPDSKGLETKEEITKTEKDKLAEQNFEPGGYHYRNTNVKTTTATGDTKDDDYSGYFNGATGKKAEEKQVVIDGILNEDIALGGSLAGQAASDSITTKSNQQELSISTDQTIADEEAVSGKRFSLETLNKPKKESKKNDNVAAAETSVTIYDNKVPGSPAMTYYNSGMYKSAISEFEKLVASNKNDYESLYFLAMSYYNFGQKDDALLQLNKIIKKKNNAFYDLALWQKALILSEKNENSAARELLEEIVKRGGTLKDKAIQKKEELNK